MKNRSLFPFLAALVLAPPGLATAEKPNPEPETTLALWLAAPSFPHETTPKEWVELAKCLKEAGSIEHPENDPALVALAKISDLPTPIASLQKYVFPPSAIMHEKRSLLLHDPKTDTFWLVQRLRDDSFIAYQGSLSKAKDGDAPEAK